MRDRKESPQRARKVIASSQARLPQLSPDGDGSFSDRSGISRLRGGRDGSNLLPLTSFPAGFTNAPRWSGRQARVFASLQTAIGIYTVSQTAVPRRSPRRPIRQTELVTDGRWIYFIAIVPEKVV
jgi:hypothetical protein